MEIYAMTRGHELWDKTRAFAENFEAEAPVENLEAEAMGVCTGEAYEIYGESISEIDVSDLSVDEVVDEIAGIVSGEKTFSFGEIDFMDWLISNP